MSFTYNSETWVPKTLDEHSKELLADINALLKSNGYDETLAGVSSNILYIFLLAIADYRATWDLKLDLAQKSLNPAECDDNQFLNILPIVGTDLDEGSYTTVDVTVTAASTGSCVIPDGAKIYLTEDIYFETTAEITITASSSQEFTMIASEKGAITITSNQLSGIGFSSYIANFSSLTNDASIEGTADETVTECRQRVIAGNTIESSIDGLITDLRALAGIQDAQVYFNPDITSDLTLEGGDVVSPRHVRIYVYGASSAIASTYWAKLNLPTEGSQTQTVTTLSDQTFTIYYNNVTETDVYINVIYPNGDTVSASVQAAIKTIILAYQSSIRVGQRITSSMIDQLFVGFTGCTIIDCTISLNGSDYYDEVIIDANSIALLDADNIDFEEHA